MHIKIVEVGNQDKTLRKEFVRFPKKLYKGCPYYVPSLVLDQLQTLDSEINPAFDHCDSQLFLAYYNNKIVGRIAAIINYEANRIWNSRNARFSFVDFIDDDNVVDALFAAAERWAKSRGMVSLLGPMGFSDLDHEGLLVEGYDRLSTLSTTYSYPYYKVQIERIGFEKEVDWKEFYIKIPKEVPARHQRIADMVSKRYGLKVLKFKSMKNIKPYLKALFDLLNKAYAPLFGFVPLTAKQIDYYLDMYATMLRWDIITLVAKVDTEELVGFGITIPNLSKALRKAQGRLLPLGWYHLLREMKGTKNPIADLMLMGVAPEFQGKGVNAIIFADFIVSANKCGFRYVESNPELELNNKMVSLWDDFESENHKVRRAYIKHF